MLGDLLSPNSLALAPAPVVAFFAESPFRSRRLCKDCCRIDVTWLLSKQREFGFGVS